jgi:Zn-finger nucleic acid-binding protein
LFANIDIENLLANDYAVYGLIAFAGVIVGLFLSKSRKTPPTATEKTSEPSPPTLKGPVTNSSSDQSKDISEVRGEIQDLNRMIDILKSEIHHKSSQPRNTIFCPVSRKPMKRLVVDSEEIDVSESGCWFDPGELVSILSRNHNFLPHLRAKYSSISQIENRISEEELLIARKEKLNQLYQLHIKTGDSVYRKAISDYESHFKNNQITSFTSPSSSPSSPSGHQGVGSAISSRQSHQSSFNASANPTTSGKELKCPSSGLPMREKIVDGVTIDVSEHGFWFDGTDETGGTPELISILNNKPGFFTKLLGKGDSLISNIESSSEDMRLRNEARSLAHNLSQLPPADEQFSLQAKKLREKIIELTRNS